MSDPRDRAGNAASRTDVGRAERKARQELRERILLLEAQLATPEGRRFVWEELARHELWTHVVSNDHGEVCRSEGRRGAGLDLHNELVRYVPARFLEMQGEAIARARLVGEENAAAHQATAASDEEERLA